MHRGARYYSHMCADKPKIARVEFDQSAEPMARQQAWQWMQRLVQTINGPASSRKGEPAYHTTSALAYKADVLYRRQGANLTLGQQ